MLESQIMNKKQEYCMLFLHISFDSTLFATIWLMITSRAALSTDPKPASTLFFKKNVTLAFFPKGKYSY